MKFLDPPSVLFLGFPCETMDGEERFLLSPPDLREIVKTVSSPSAGFIIESGYGKALGINDNDWRVISQELKGSARVFLNDAQTVYSTAHVIFKVKPPLRKELKFFRAGQILSCFLHPSGNPKLVKALKEIGVVALPFEQYVQNGVKEILDAMSRVTGPLVMERLLSDTSKNEGAVNTDQLNMGFLGGRGKVCQHAIHWALERGIGREHIYPFDLWDGDFRAETGDTYRTYAIENQEVFGKALRKVNLWVWAALKPDGTAPQLISRSDLKFMPPGTRIVDVACDEGGNGPFRKLTSHSSPSFTYEQTMVYRIPNWPGLHPELSAPPLIRAVKPLITDVLKHYPHIPQEWIYKYSA